VEYEEGLILLQDFVKKRPLILVGSGLSVSMGIPGMGELLERLTERLPNILSKKALSEWNECLELIKEKGFEEGLLEKRISMELLVEIISETADFIGEHDERFCNNLYTMKLEDFPFAKLLNHLLMSLPPSIPNVNVITTNYDHLIEYACDLINVECCTGFRGLYLQHFTKENLKENYYKRVLVNQKTKSKAEYRIIPKIRLLKPHGSLKWQRINNATFQSNKIVMGSDRIIITPGSTKFEASLTDYVMNTHREIANDCLNNAESVIIIGYGFNDSHLQTVLTERLKEGLSCLILTRTLSNNAKKIISSCNQIIALELESTNQTRWYFNGENGIWNAPIWDLKYFVEKVL
jgi:hypothetical protein